VGIASYPHQKRPNIAMLMQGDTGWNDFGAFSLGGAGLDHPTPNVDQEWVGQDFVSRCVSPV
jgi:arylsulfatase